MDSQVEKESNWEIEEMGMLLSWLHEYRLIPSE